MSTATYTSTDGRKIPITDMATQHLKNAIRKIQSDIEKGVENNNADALDAMQEEFLSRELAEQQAKQALPDPA